MPTSVSGLLKSQNLALTGKVKWGENFRSSHRGIYIVSYLSDAEKPGKIIPKAPISAERIEFWKRRVPTNELDRRINPATELIADRLSKFWLPNENILYIGMTTATLSIRVSQYYSTELGERRPHAGGHWLKTLSILPDLYIYYSECDNPQEIETGLLDYFGDNVSKESIESLLDSSVVLPFANLGHPNKGRKRHSIGKSKLND